MFYRRFDNKSLSVWEESDLLDLAKLTTIKYCRESDDTPVENLADHRQKHLSEQGGTQSQHPGHHHLHTWITIQDTDDCDL